MMKTSDRVPVNSNPPHNAPIHICHVIHRLEYGGMQNGVVNIINTLNPARFRHTILCLTDANEFKERITAPNTQIVELHKKAGKDFGAYKRVWQVFRDLKPDIVHTRNMAAVDMIYVARLAGIRNIIHSEHGLDVFEPDGKNVKYNMLRRYTEPFTKHYIAMSADLARWLKEDVKLPPEKVSVFYNGVDTTRFTPGPKRLDLAPEGFADEQSIILGTVGRLETIKDQITLAQAFIRALELRPGLSKRLRLVIIGDGDLRRDVEEVLMTAKASHLTWLAGFQANAAQYYQLFDIFVLPSIREGISNTLLEAQATGLPIIATAVGGTPEIVAQGEAGTLVPAQDPQAMAEAIIKYVEEPTLIKTQGTAARMRMEAEFSLERMVDDYQQLYEQVVR